MRTLITILFTAVVSCAVAQDYTISCNVSADYNGKSAYLVNKNGGDTISSCIIADGAFSFGGKLDDGALLDVVVNRIKGVAASVLAEKGMKIAVDMTTRPAKVSDDGGLNDRFAAIILSVKEASGRLGARAKQLYDEGKSEEEVLEIMKDDTDSLYDIYRNAIKENRNNILGAYLLSLAARQIYASSAELDAVMSDVKYSAKFKSLKKIRTALYYGEKTRPGNMFVDFSGFSLDGTASKLSDYVGKGKYVLVDFWASWCGPCKKAMPKVIELNNRYSGDKFMTIGVNIGDVEEKFKATAAELGIPYPQIFVPKNSSDENNAAMLYNVETIPHLILFAPDGTILERGFGENELESKLEKCIK